MEIGGNWWDHLGKHGEERVVAGWGNDVQWWFHEENYDGFMVVECWLRVAFHACGMVDNDGQWLS